MKKCSKFVLLSMFFGYGSVVCMEKNLETVLPLITKQLCIDHHYQPYKIKNDIKSLAWTNKFFYQYYNQEKTGQQMVRFCSHGYNLNAYGFKFNDAYVARELGYTTIEQKIDRLSTLVRKKEEQFTENDLQDIWYLNSSTNCINRSLLYIAIDHLNLDKAQQIIEFSEQLDFQYNANANILLNIANLRDKICYQYKYLRNQYTSKKLLAIAESLLKKGILVNGYGNGTIPLMDAVIYGDKLFANLLLEYGADPCLEKYDIFAQQSFNSFQLEQGEPKGWLTEMVKSNNNNQKARLILQQVQDQRDKECLEDFWS